MSQTVEHAPMVQERRGLIETFAANYNIKAENVLPVLKDTILPNGKATNEQVQAFLVVCNEYELNPFTKEIYAFPAKNGGVTPIVGVDGWVKLIHRQGKLDGISFEEVKDDNGRLLGTTCRIHRKDTGYPFEVTEYLDECSRNTDPWKTSPRRMLRHRALIQCGRVAFGLSGIMEKDEYERMIEVEGRVVDDDEGAAKSVRDKVRGKINKRKTATDAPTEEAAPKEVDVEAEVIECETEQEREPGGDDDEPDAGDSQSANEPPEAYVKLYRAFDVHEEEVDKALKSVGLPDMLGLVWQDLDEDGLKLLKRAHSKYVKSISEG